MYHLMSAGRCLGRLRSRKGAERAAAFLALADFTIVYHPEDST